MSEEFTNRVQLGTFISGDQYVFRTNDGTELKEVLEGVAENADGIVTALNALKQVGVANGIMTGDSQKKGAAPTTRSPSNGRAADMAPPSNNGDVPQCLHGDMLDLADKGYKKRWYCPKKGKSKECWAKD